MITYFILLWAMLQLNAPWWVWLLWGLGLVFKALAGLIKATKV